MKHNLGKLCILFCFVWLQAEDFSYLIKASHHEVYLHEPLHLSVDLNQTNPNVVLLFQFVINKSPDYSFKPVFSKNGDTPHHTNQHTVYEVTPLKTGDIHIGFSLTKRVTTDDKVSYFASGDRDDFKKLETIDFPITLPDIKLHVKALPKDTQLVGDFTLDYTLKKHQAKPYEAIPFQVTLKGKGFPPLLPHLLPQDGNFTLFTENPIVKSTSTIAGTQSSIHYSMALSHTKDFTLPQVQFKAFNPKTRQSYILTIPSQDFKIIDVDKNTLLDHTDYPPFLKSDWAWIQTLLKYLVVFVAGFLSALAFRWQKKAVTQTQNPLIEKIQNTKDLKALLQLLMAQDSHRFASSIRDLENALYGDGKIKPRNININKVKEEAIDLV